MTDQPDKQVPQAGAPATSNLLRKGPTIGLRKSREARATAW